MSSKDFQLLAKLGEGAFSSVWRVKRISDSQEYAMKKVKLTPLSEKEKQNAINEVRILASINNPNIIGYKEAFFEDVPLTLCIVMEHAGGGDILNKINQHQKSNTHFKEKDIWRYATQMIMGLKTLHDMKILHRDLKCANVFLSTDGKAAKLGDLNVSKVAKNNLVYTQTGTPYYASPEVWKDQPYDSKSDIWSLGCVIYEMCALKPPFRANDMQGLFKKIQRGVFDRIPSHYSIDLYNLISMCLQVKPSLRPSCDQLLTHPVIRKNGGEFIQELGPSEETNELLNTIIVPRNIKALANQLPKANYSPEQSSVDSERGRVPESVRNNQPASTKRPTSQHVANSKNRIIVRESQSRESRVSQMQKIEPPPVKESERDYLARMQKEYIDRARAIKPLVEPAKPSNYQDLLVQKSPQYRILSGKKPAEDYRERQQPTPLRGELPVKNDPYYVPSGHARPRVIDPRKGLDDISQPSIDQQRQKLQSREKDVGPERALINRQEYLLNKYQNYEQKQIEDRNALPRVYSDKADILMRKADHLIAKYQAANPNIKGTPSNLIKKEPNDILEKYRNLIENRADYNSQNRNPNIYNQDNRADYNSQYRNPNLYNQDNRNNQYTPSKNYLPKNDDSSNWNQRRQHPQVKASPRPLWWG